MSQSHLTNAQRLELCQYKAKNKVGQAALGIWAQNKFKLQKPLSQAAISKILGKHAQLETMNEADLEAKCPCVAQHPELEEALTTWVLQKQARNVAITGNLIKTKAGDFANRLNIP